MYTFPKDIIVEALENAGFDEDNIYGGHDGIYLGRYGIRGAGVVLPRDGGYGRFMLELGRLIDDDLADTATTMADRVHMDNMGRDDLIYCWPDTTLTD